jgi:hypothetical protein
MKGRIDDIAAKVCSAIGLRPGPLECLAGVDAIEIKEKVQFLEAFSAWLGHEIEMANKYVITAKGGRDSLFYVAETTGFLGRNMKSCFGDCVPWSADVWYAQALGKERAYELEMLPGCSCCCFCFRPYVEMREADLEDGSNGAVVGAIRSDFPLFCGPNFTVLNHEGTEVLTAFAGCCQCGYWCPCPCGPCKTMDFAVTDVESGDLVATLTKKVPGLLSFLFASDVDNYDVDFHAVQSPTNRALLMALTLFIDFRFFNQNASPGMAKKAAEVVGVGKDKDDS